MDQKNPAPKPVPVPEPVAEPVTTPSMSDDTPAVVPAPKAAPANTKPSFHNIPSSPEHHDPVALLEAHRTNRTPVVAAILAVVIALAIAGLVYFVYTQSRDDTKSDDTTMTQESTQTAATEDDVDTTNADLDKDLDAADDAADFAESDLSDTSLGL
jgi:uncharacterized protein HemX